MAGAGGSHAGRIARLIARALLLRCPRCGRATAMQRWFTVRPSCTACRFRFDRGEPGYFQGAGCLNLVVAELLFAVGLVTAVALTWPVTPWTALTIVGAFVVALMPILFFPWSRTLWIALDLALRPSESHDESAAEDGV